MIYALDTNIISYLLRPSKNQEVVARFRAEIQQGNDYVIPPLCYYETMWYLLKKNATAQISVFENLYNNSFATIGMGETDFQIAARTKASLVKKGTPVGEKDADIFIAAYCIVNEYTLVTNNTKHFERINGIKLANWAQK